MRSKTRKKHRTKKMETKEISKLIKNYTKLQRESLHPEDIKEFNSIKEVIF